VKKTRSLTTLVALVSLLGTGSAAHAGPTNGPDMSKLQTPIYAVEGDSLVRRNGNRFNNRPLYGNQVYYVTLAGDRPMLRVGGAYVHNGVFMLAFVRGESAVWLHDFDDVVSAYTPGQMKWTLADKRFPGVKLICEAVPGANGMTSAVRLHVEGAVRGDRVIWAFGGASKTERQAFLWDWDITTQGRDALMDRRFQPELCADDQVEWRDGMLRLASPPLKEERAGAVRCSIAGETKLADADAWTDPLKLLASTAGARPLGVGVVAADVGPTIDWSVVTATPDQIETAIKQFADPSALFDGGAKRAAEVRERVVVDTPDDRLDVAIASAGHVLDGIHRDSVYTHSGMRWGVPLIGWRSIYGPTAFGWHDRVLQQARVCLAKQITESDKTEAVADPVKKLASQALTSRLFGKGRVAIYHGNHYDMQSQFFDQLIDAWRATADAELEKLLRPALELHLEYIRECFDPDNDGLYESYTNSWPTDGQWYSGGATSEETAYAYNGHRAAMDLARRAGDMAGAERHDARMKTIRNAFNAKLWLADRGHPAAYIEQTGLQRTHASYWLYTIFCPVEAGLLDRVQSVLSLSHTEHELERVAMPYGGEQCWPSNWVPSIWSVRQMWPGDNYALAQAYFETGLSEKGWDLLRGTFPESLQYGPVPGDMGYPAGGTDFSDCASPFARVVVRGLFGFRPDYPADRVTIAPQFPESWDHASIRTPDASIAFKRSGDFDRYEVTLARPASIDLTVPVHADGIESVLVNGEAATPTFTPGFGRADATFLIKGSANPVVVELRMKAARPVVAAVEVDAEVGQALSLRSEAGPIIDVVDPQSALVSAQLNDGAIAAKHGPTPGARTVFAHVKRGDVDLWQPFHIRTRDLAAEAELKRVTLLEAPATATWKPIDITDALNADVRTIYQQEYLSPRPNTVSLRMATDGYSTWQMVLDPKKKAPEIALDNVAALTGEDKLIRTANGAKFIAPRLDGKNIAFASIWDNWPRSRTASIDAAGEGIFFLIAGTTNPMQVRIANATLRLQYEDGVEETIDLVPPFNFWTLCPLDRVDYNLKRDAFAIGTPPPVVQLGDNCRANIVGRRLRPGVKLKSVTLHAKSPEVVVGLMGLSVMNPAP
jgi:hypothetical protein